MASRFILNLILILEVAVFVITLETEEAGKVKKNGGGACKKQDEKTFHECLKKGNLILQNSLFLPNLLFNPRTQYERIADIYLLLFLTETIHLRVQVRYRRMWKRWKYARFEA